jgi:signal peptidase II
MKLNKLIQKNFYNFLFILLIFLLDQISKYFVLEYFNQSSNKTFVVNSFISFNFLWNNGIAFGLFQFEDRLFYNIFTFLILGVLIILFWLSSRREGIEKKSYLMILGGGLGNVFDRLMYGSVIDFIDLNYKNFHWFIFNVADMFITTGIIILIVLEFFKKND